MIYHGECYSRANDKKYSFTIARDSVGEKELTLQAGGLQMSMRGGVTDPIKGTGLSISVLTDELPLDIYTVEPKAVKVNLREEGTLIWQGYVTPNVYDQDFRPNSRLTIECRDAVATLKDIRYTNPTNKASDSILGYIKRGLSEVILGDVSSIIDIVEPFADITTDEMYISDGNWYNEDNEPMSWYEVISECLKYCGLQLIYWRGRVKIADHRYIDNAIDIDGYSANYCPSISLTESYQRVRVTDSMYSRNDIYDGWLTEDAEFTGVSTTAKRKMLKEENGKNYARTDVYFYTNKKIKQYAYDSSTLAPVENDGTTDGSLDVVGGYLVKAATQKIYDGYSTTTHLPEERPANEDYKEYILLTKFLANGNAAYEQLPMITITDNINRRYVKGNVIVISASVVLTPNDGKLVIDTSDSNKYYYTNPLFGTGTVEKEVKWPIVSKTGTVTPDAPDAYLALEVKLGDYYYVGAITQGAAWSTTKGMLKIPFSCKNCQPEKGSTTDYLYNYYNKEIKLRNNIEVWDGIGKEGWGINAENEGKLEVSILGFHSEDDGTGQGVTTYVGAMWISDFAISVERKTNRGVQLAAPHDNYYENVISDNAVKEYNSVKLKVCSDDGENYGLATVLKKDVWWVYSGKVKSKFSGGVLLPEEHLVQKLHELYAQPRRVLKGTWRKLLADCSQGVESSAMLASYRITAANINIPDGTSELELEEV